MALLDDNYALIYSNTRAIGDIIPDVVVEEIGNDDLFVTLHPVEKGAAVSDHAFKMPATVEMRCGFSDSSVGTVGYVQEVYERLLALQLEREPFDVFTGKRAYTSMLIRSLTQVTDQKSANALMIVCRLQEVLIVDTEGGSAPQSAQASPARTAPVQNTGSRQLAQSAYAPGGA
jgi:hypothetical protein